MNATMKQKTTNKHGYSYSASLAASQKVNWRIEDVIGGDKQLDFSKTFLPESLARIESLDFLSADEKRTPRERLICSPARSSPHGPASEYMT